MDWNLNNLTEPNTLDFYVLVLVGLSTVSSMLMAAESTYYESLASVRYVDEVMKGTEPDVKEAKTPYLL